MIEPDWIYEERQGKSLIVSLSDFGAETEQAKVIASGPPPFSFVASLASCPCSILFLRDRNRLWYHAGVDGLASDLHGLAGKVVEFAAGRRILTMGQSMGGFAALALGLLGAADQVLAMSPQTFLDAETRARFRDPRWGWAVERVSEKSPTQDLMNLGPHFRALVETRAKFVTYYGTDHPVDQHHANNVVVPSISSAIAIEKCGHLTARHLRDSGELARIIDKFAGASS